MTDNFFQHMKLENEIGLVERGDRMSTSETEQPAPAVVRQLVEHPTKAHAFIENTAAFGQGASLGILDCGGCIWNIDESKAALAAAREAGLGPLLIPKNLR